MVAFDFETDPLKEWDVKRLAVVENQRYPWISQYVVKELDIMKKGIPIRMPRLPTLATKTENKTAFSRNATEANNDQVNTRCLNVNCNWSI